MQQNNINFVISALDLEKSSFSFSIKIMLGFYFFGFFFLWKVLQKLLSQNLRPFWFLQKVCIIFSFSLVISSLTVRLGIIVPTHYHHQINDGRVESHSLRVLVQSKIPLTRPSWPPQYCGPQATALIDFTAWSPTQRMCQCEEREFHYDGKRTGRGSTPLLSVTETRGGKTSRRRLG